MKRLREALCVGLCLAATSVSAADYVVAADLGAHDWSGFYAGLRGGSGWGRTDAVPLVPFVGEGGMTAQGCSLDGSLFPIVGNRRIVDVVGPQVQTPDGQIGRIYNLILLGRDEADAFNFVPDGPQTTLEGRVIDVNGLRELGRSFIVQPLTLAPGLDPRAILLGSEAEPLCEVVRTGFDTLVEPGGAIIPVTDRGTFVLGGVTQGGLPDAFAGAAGVDADTLAALAGIEGREIDIGLSGAVGGAQLGYNWQRGRFVYGIEAQFSASGLNGGENVGMLAARADLEWFGSVRGRAGFAFDRLFAYASAGIAFGEIELSYELGGVSVEDSQRHVGFAGGVGAEYAFTERLSAALEYSYLDFGKKNYFEDVGLDTKLDAHAHTLTFGVNYRF